MKVFKRSPLSRSYWFGCWAAYAVDKVIASIDSSQEGTAVSHSTQRDGGGGKETWTWYKLQYNSTTVVWMDDDGGNY